MTLVVRRGITALILFWLVVSLTFVLVRAAPGDPAQLLVAPGATAGEAARMRAALGLDAPLAEQYALWIGGVLRGNLGASFVSRRPVTTVLAEALPVSLWLGSTSLALTFLIGVGVGMWQATRKGTVADALATALTTTIYAAPSYWLALALVAVFTYGATKWGFPAAFRLPAFGVRSPAGDLQGLAAIGDLVRHAILPVAVLTAVGAAGIARYARVATLDLLNADWVRTAQSKGLAQRTVMGRHLLANALPPLIVLLGLALPGVIAGSVFVESVFAWPGMGRAMLSAIASRDYPVVMGATMLYAALVILANLVADLLLPLIDPRRRA